MFNNLTHIEFANSWALYLLPGVLLAAIGWWYFIAQRNLATVKISSGVAFQGFTNPWKGKLKKYLPLMRVLALVFLLLALARPQTSYDEEKVTTEGIDIVLAIDVSTSMLAQDFKPNRLEAAKKEAASFTDGRPHDRIGLVVFAGESFSQCPVTIDHKIVKKQLENIKNGLLEDGTAIGMGLATSVQRLKDSESKSKVVILMTDGVNNKGLIDPATASDIAMQYNVRVYTIGVGTNGQAMTPVGMYPNGQLAFQLADVQIDEEILKDIAKKTGGQYFRATNNKRLKDIYEQIDKLEKTKIEVSAYERKTEKFHAFAFLALVCIAFEIAARYLFLKSIP
jgi:Ca-activated chloride channel family protein